MNTQEDVRAIADGLSATQARRVLRLIPNERMMGGFGEDWGCPGLIERVGINHPIFGSHYQLTPRGRDVAAHLQSQGETS